MSVAIETHAALACAPAPVRRAVRALLVEADDEFTPPLSARDPEAGLSVGARAEAGRTPDVYWRAIQNHALLTARCDGEAAGVMSFVEGRVMPALDLTATVYLGTLITAKAARGRGVARSLYAALFAHARALDPRGRLVTRTWSTNHTHLPLLRKLGFEEAKRLPGDRGAGIDTIYFVSPL